MFLKPNEIMIQSQETYNTNIMHCVYFITAIPCEDFLSSLHQQLSNDIQAGRTISQCFFYADAVAIGALLPYPSVLQDFIILADEHDINLNLCSAAFQGRHLSLSNEAKQDFNFKGLGQLIAESQVAHQIRVFSQ